MRVALVCPRFAPDIGGIEEHVAQLGRRLAAAGADVQVLTQSGPGPAPEETLAGMRVRRFRLPLPAHPDLPAPGLVAALGRLDDVDVVHAHSYHALPALAASMTAGRAPLVLTPHFHGAGHTRLRNALHVAYRPLGRRLVARADAVVAVSPSEAALLDARFGAGARTTVIPNGVSDVPLGQPYRRSRTTVLACARLEPYKQVDVLIAALALLPDRMELVVVGDGPVRPDLEVLAARLGVADRVVFAGHVSDAELARWRGTASVFASASSHESFGLTVAEALAAGIPTVASDIAAHRDVVTMAGAGPRAQLVPAEPATVAAAVGAALDRPRPAAGACGLLGWDEVAERTLALYGSVLARAPGLAGARP